MADIRDPEYPIRLNGLRQPLKPHQAFAVYWMLARERTDCHGGFLCDEMGLGKVCRLPVLAAGPWSLT
jgi:hypothetical protein